MAESSKDDIFSANGLIRPECLTEPAETVLRESLRLARDTRWDSVRSPHIFMGLLAVPDAGVALLGRTARGRSEQAAQPVPGALSPAARRKRALLVLNREFLSDNVLRLLRDSYTRALDHHRPSLTPMDLLITLLTASNSIVAECFERIGVTAAKLTELAVIAEQRTGT